MADKNVGTPQSACTTITDPRVLECILVSYEFAAAQNDVKLKKLNIS